MGALPHMQSNGRESSSRPGESTNPRLVALQSKMARLHDLLADLKTQRQELANGTAKALRLPTPDHSTDEEKLSVALKAADKVTKTHIQRLQRYNEIKDAGVDLIGLIADRRQARVVNVMGEFGVAEGD